MRESGSHLAGAAATGLGELLHGYHVPVGHYDELLDGSSHPRLHWSRFGYLAGPLDAGELSRAEKRIARQLHESGVTYNIHATVGTPRPWALDVLPHLEDDGGKILVRLLLAEDVETLDEGQAGVDHDRELPREDREVLRRHALARLGRVRPGLGLGFSLCRRLGRIDACHHDLLAAQRRDSRVHRVGYTLASDRLSSTRSP